MTHRSSPCRYSEPEVFETVQSVMSAMLDSYGKLISESSFSLSASPTEMQIRADRASNTMVVESQSHRHFNRNTSDIVDTGSMLPARSPMRNG